MQTYTERESENQTRNTTKLNVPTHLVIPLYRIDLHTQQNERERKKNVK